jgi:hypothetical protein
MWHHFRSIPRFTVWKRLMINKFHKQMKNKWTRRSNTKNEDEQGERIETSLAWRWGELCARRKPGQEWSFWSAAPHQARPGYSRAPRPFTLSCRAGGHAFFFFIFTFLSHPPTRVLCIQQLRIYGFKPCFHCSRSPRFRPFARSVMYCIFQGAGSAFIPEKFPPRAERPWSWSRHSKLPSLSRFLPKSPFLPTSVIFLYLPGWSTDYRWKYVSKKVKIEDG